MRKNVLILCTGNSARSILAEALLNRMAGDRYVAFSAGSHPLGQVNRHALALLDKLGFETSGLRSKSWDEFSGRDAPDLDLVITVCGDAAAETYPVWPGAPLSVHWGIADPAKFEGNEAMKQAAFEEAFGALKRRIAAFLEIDLDGPDRAQIKAALAAIGDIS